MNTTAPPKATSPRWQARLLFLAYVLVLFGQILFFYGLILHQEKFLRTLGTAKTMLLLGGGLLPCLLLVVGLIWRRQELPQLLRHTVYRLNRIPGIVPAFLFLGATSLLCVLFFWTLLSLFLNVPPFGGSLLATYGGCILLLYAVLPRQRLHERGQQLALMLTGVVFALVVTEIGLRLLNPFPDYLLLPRNARWEFYPDLEAVPGIEGQGLYTTNDQAIRGDPYRASDPYHLLAIGGSTTEESLLDDSEAWTHLLQEQLNREHNLGDRGSIWVGNVGRSGHGLVEHIHALEYFVPQFEIDAVILLVGVNDLSPILQRPDAYHATYEDPENYVFYLHRSFYSRPLVDERIPRPFPENTAVWNLVYSVLWRRLSTLPQKWVSGPGKAQARSSVALLLPELPDLTPALVQYRQNLLRLLALARAQHIRLVFATQPAVWREDLSPEMAQRLWFGFRGDIAAPDGRYDPMALRAGLDRFNQVLLDFCREQQVECVDLAAAMNGEEAYFYDDVHFNEAGARAVADLLAAHFRDHGLTRQ